ncbi:MAG: primosomal protein N', partial [Spirochaetia bacterium]|nr:primosomal protein N' [Spirochaetia bacterium]
QKISQYFTEKQKNDAASTEILGPSECPLSKISGSFRWQIILRGPGIKTLQQAASKLFYNYSRPADVYIETDVDPVNLL